MGFKKGQILKFKFPAKEDSRVIEDWHKVIVLFSRNTPYRTETIATITSLKSLASQGKVPSNYLKLSAEDYPFVLDHDSYVNLDMIITIDGDDLEKLEAYGREYNAFLQKFDCEALDYKLALTYELQSFVEKENGKAIKTEVENIIEYIDTDVRDKVNKIMDILNDPIAVKLLQDLIDIDLITILKKEYDV